MSDVDLKLDSLFYSVKDDQSTHEFPAMTTMFYRVCGSDLIKFDETIRLIKLYMEAAYQLGKGSE